MRIKLNELLNAFDVEQKFHSIFIHFRNKNKCSSDSVISINMNSFGVVKINRK